MLRRSITARAVIAVSCALLLMGAGIAAACEGGGQQGCLAKASVTTDAATSVNYLTATLNGTINPNGCLTTYEIKWGLTQDYGSGVAGFGSVGPEGGAKSVQAVVSVKPSTTYHYRVYASNFYGTSEGSDKSFTTPPKPVVKPEVSTGSATEVNSSSALLHGTVDANGAPTTYYFKYGTTTEVKETTKVESAGSGEESAPFSKAVTGLLPNTKYYFRIVASNSAGTSEGSNSNFTTTGASWKIQSTPNASGAEHSNLYDISCEPASTTACTAVGKQTATGGVSSPYAQYWNGASWVSQTTATPAGATAAELQSNHCLSKTSCVAAGSYTTASGTFTLVEAWNGTSWSIQTSPNPAGSIDTHLKGISCKEVSACIAVGYQGSGSSAQPVAIRGNSGTWSLGAVPLPSGAVGAELTGVECTSTTSCRAVGRYYPTVSPSTYWGMVSTWNGTTWSSEAVPKPTGEPKRSTLLDISCASASNCTAVGAYANSGGTQVSYVERWNGSAWSWQSSPNPAESTNTVFQNVSCTEGVPCVAVGDWLSAGVWRPMAQFWNGSSWVIESVEVPAGSTFGLFEGVACRSVCLATGWYTSSGKDKTLGEIR